ncbi:MAG: hypothetical protein HYY66_03365 [Candidatus Tectomicrobia bacterium]|nr:hypothetical protein [Candidatus Tectomicrobia bacterium]
MHVGDVVKNISPPFDATLAGTLLKEYVSLETRYIRRDWEPATLDGGQFCEVAARCVYHIDSGNLNPTKGVDDCLAYVEDPQNNNLHKFPSRKDALQLSRAIRLAYKFRSSRGAIHIDPKYSANEMDARLVVETVRWMLCELVRIFWTGDSGVAAQVVREIVTHRIPAVFRDGAMPVVQNPDLDAETEILVLLYDSGSIGMGLGNLKEAVLRHRRTVEKGVLSLAKKRLITKSNDGSFILTDRGRMRVEKDLQETLDLN